MILVAKKLIEIQKRALMLNGKKRIRRNPDVPRNMYFGEPVQESIELYHETQCSKEKIKIFENSINPAFEHLVDKLIKVYDFKSPNHGTDELKAECVSFLYESMHKWDSSRGTKAFSYFNVVAKNWLILNTRKHIKKSNLTISLEDFDILSPAQKSQIEEYSVIPSPEDSLVELESKFEIIKMLEDMKVKVNNENELRCLHAIETLFDSIDELELLNKRAIRIYLVEISGLDKKIVSKSLASLKKHYKNAVKESLYDIF
jgi:hypothetical protein